jgi:hypothetical protein
MMPPLRRNWSGFAFKSAAGSAANEPPVQAALWSVGIRPGDRLTLTLSPSGVAAVELLRR